jgi:hypothetical protein
MQPDIRNVPQKITTFWNTVAPFYNADPSNLPSLENAEDGAKVRAIEKLLPASPADVLDIGTRRIGRQPLANDGIHKSNAG